MRNFLDDSVWDKMNLRCLGGIQVEVLRQKWKYETNWMEFEREIWKWYLNE